MKPEEKEELKHRTEETPEPEPIFNKQDPPKLRFKGNRRVFIQKTFVTREPTDDGDRIATEQLIMSTRDGAGYKCPRCDYSTASIDDMTEHLSEEINKSLNVLTTMYKRHTKPTDQRADNSPHGVHPDQEGG